MSDESSDERQALESARADLQRGSQELQRLADDRRRSAIDHIRAAIADYRWLTEQAIPLSTPERLRLIGLEKMVKKMPPPE